MLFSRFLESTERIVTDLRWFYGEWAQTAAGMTETINSSIQVQSGA